jgi:predicted GNAT family acetyltransferase
MEDDEIKDEQETLVAGIKKTVDAQVDEYINEIPEEYRNIIDHLKIGGTPEAYMQQKATIDYKGLDYKDTRVQEALVRANLSQQGYDQETVDDKVKDLQDLDKMEKEARIAGNSFDVKQTERVDNFDKQVAKDLKAVEDAELQEIEDITKAIDGMTEMVGFKLSKKRKEDFKKYLFDVDSEGETAASKASKDPDNRLKLYFLDFINYDFKDMEKAVATKSSRNFSKLINRHTDVQSKSRGKTVVVEDPEPVEGKLHIHSMFDRAGDD